MVSRELLLEEKTNFPIKDKCIKEHKISKNVGRCFGSLDATLVDGQNYKLNREGIKPFTFELEDSSSFDEYNNNEILEFTFKNKGTLKKILAFTHYKWLQNINHGVVPLIMCPPSANRSYSTSLQID